MKNEKFASIQSLLFGIGSTVVEHLHNHPKVKVGALLAPGEKMAIKALKKVSVPKQFTIS
jgi:hypothetical protein